MSEFDSFLPIAKRIFAKTISNDLVSVQPMGSNSEEELNRIKKEVQSENRDRKIDSIVENNDFEEMKISDHPDYKKLPEGKLFYLDFKYNNEDDDSFSE
jgi:hypothetical protein